MGKHTDLKKAAAAFKDAQRLENKGNIPQVVLKLRSACRHAPEEDVYAFHLAMLLYEQIQFQEAEPLYLRLLKNYRELLRQAETGKISLRQQPVFWLPQDTSDVPERNPLHQAIAASLLSRKTATLGLKKQDDILDPLQANLATILNNLANLYKETQRLAEAESHYLEALSIRRRLAKENPQAHEKYVAATLNNLASLYSDTQRLTEAESNYLEALSIRRRLAKENPQAYEKDVAATLNNLALLYSNIQRLTEAESHYLDALSIRRRLAENNPQAHEKEVAATLNNLANLYSATQRQNEAKDYYEQSLAIYRPLAQVNPDAHNIGLARILFNLGQLYADHPEQAKNYFQEATKTLAHFSDRAETIPIVGEFLQSIAEEQEKQQNLYRAKLEEKNRQEYLGMMASATAHQINQPIGSIRAMIDSARTRLRDGVFKPEKIEPLLEDLWAQSERLKNIINNFQRFAAGDRASREAVNLNKVVQNTVALFEAQLKQRNIVLTVNLDEKPPLAWLNSFQLQEALINLLTNARDALEGRQDGTLLIETGHGLANNVFLRVQDNGPGVPEEFAARMFTPFTTTKPTEKGTGMGLYISRKIVTEAGGTLEYRTNPEGGACFEILLPRYEPKPME